MKQSTLTNGYRINFINYRDIFDSLFMIHNQTVNIWSHLIGAILVLIVLTSFVWYEYDKIFVFGMEKKQIEPLF
jgi:adiponectin receptor